MDTIQKKRGPQLGERRRLFKGVTEQTASSPLYAIRKALGLSQKEMAGRCGFKYHEDYGRYERGEMKSPLPRDYEKRRLIQDLATQALDALDEKPVEGVDGAVIREVLR